MVLASGMLQTNVRGARMRVDREVLAEDQVVLELRLERTNRQEELQMRMRKVGAEWRLAGP